MKVEYTREQAEKVLGDYAKHCGLLIIHHVRDFLDHKFKPSIEVGTWVMEKDGRTDGEVSTIFVTEVGENNFNGFGIFNGDWYDLESLFSDKWLIDAFQPAPDHIVIERMTDFVKKRYAVGDEAQCLCVGGEKEIIKGLVLDKKELITNGRIWVPSSDIVGVLLMQKGKWATKVEKTYSIGDRFETDDDEYILTSPERYKANLVNLRTGISWTAPVEVKNKHKITQAEFKEITGNPKEFKQINK